MEAHWGENGFVGGRRDGRGDPRHRPRAACSATGNSINWRRVFFLVPHDRESDRKAFTGKVPPEKLSTSGTIEPNRVGGEAGVPHPGIPPAP